MISTLLRRARSALGTSLPDPRNYQPPSPVPAGYSKDGILKSLVTLSIDGSATGELLGYATADCERFLHTLDLVPQGQGELLEIGSNPYFTTQLLRRFRPDYRLSLTNYFGGGLHEAKQQVRFRDFDDVENTTDFTYQNLNIESSPFPFEDDRFDVVVFGEVLEHLTNDPMRALQEIARVLKPDGRLVLTTPNAARLENVVAFIEGRNIYDPYSAYGPYGRHNREYTRHELHMLMQHCGFEAEKSFTANVHGDIPVASANSEHIRTALDSVRDRQHDLGQYLFTRWRNLGTFNPKFPSWLYRSYPAERMAD